MKKKRNLSMENKELKARLVEAEELLAAIKRGEVDAFITDDQQVFTLKSADHAYRVLVETINEGAATLTLDGTMMYCNLRLANMLDMPIEKIIGSSVFNLVGSNELPKLKSALRQCENSTVRSEFQLKKVDGTFLPVLVSCNSLKVTDTALCMVITDLTEQKKNELELEKHRVHLEELVKARTNELRESEERFRVAQELSPDGFTIFKPVRDKKEKVVDFIWVYENAAIARMIGKDPKSVVGKRLLDLFPGHRGSRFFETYKKVAETGKIIVVEDSYQGESIQALTWFRVAVVSMGEDIAILTQDITERKRVEADLAAAHWQIQSVIDNTTSLVYACDLEARFVMANAPLAALLNTTPAQMLGKRRHEFMSQEDADRHEANDREVLAAGRAMEFEEHSELPGHSITWLSTKFPLRDAQGRIYAVAGIVTDITARKRAEEALKEAERRYRRLFESAKDGILILDFESGLIVDVNPFLTGLLGYSREELCKKHLWEIGFFEDIASSKESFSKLQTSNYVRYEDLPLQMKDGEKIDVEFVSNVYLVDHKKVIQCNIRDITLSKRAKDILKRDKQTMEKLVQEQAQKLAEAQIEIDRAARLSDIGILAATVAHELRNPLAAIQMAAHNIKRKANNPDLDKHLANIEKKVGESDQIINNLLFYSRLKTPCFETIDIYNIIEECVEVFDRPAKKGVIVTKVLDPIKDILIEADPFQIKEVFHNILNNAHDAVPQEKGEIKIVAENEDEFVKVAIEDNGPGIAKDIIDKIFDPFFTTKAKGTGLGLSVCRQIVTMHDGEIGVKHGFTKGTSIFVRLPKERKKERKNKWPLNEF